MKTLWTNIKNYTKDFIKGDDGMEFLQVAIIVCLVVGLIAVLVFLFDKISEKITEAGNEVNSMNTGPSNTSTSSPTPP